MGKTWYGKTIEEGQPCWTCHTPLVRRSHDGPSRPGQRYWYKAWLACPTCGRNYMLESEKVEVTNDDQLSFWAWP